MQLQFQIFPNYLFMQLQFFFPELILHKYSVEGYVPFKVPSHKVHYLRLANTPKIKYTKEVEVRVGSHGETRCINQQQPKTKR